MIVDFPVHVPDCSTNLREIGPLSAREPASAKPRPSRTDFFPSSTTEAGMSSYFVRTTKSPTYLVRPSVLGKSSAPALFPACAVSAKMEAPTAASELLPKSRRRIIHRDLWRSRAECHRRELRLPCRRDVGQPDSSD